MNTLVTLTVDDIKKRVESSNSFTKEEMENNRALIVTARANRRKELANLGGIEVGAVVARLQKENDAKIVAMTTKSSAKQQSWTIRLTAKRNVSPAQRAAERVANLQKQLAAAKAEQAKATATNVETKPVTTPAPTEPAKA